GTEKIACASDFDDDLGLAVESVFGRQRSLSMDERQPFHGAVFFELGNIQRTLVEQVHVGGAVVRIIGAGGHELVDIVEALVVTQIEYDAPVLGDDGLRPLMLEAAERS